MATQIQLRGGTTAENLLFTGAQREITVDTDKHAVIVHDGVTAGGYPMATSPQVTNGTFYYNEDPSSASDAYILAPKMNTNTPSVYADGVQFGFITTHPNTGPATANFQGLGVKSLKYPGGIDPLAGEISGRVYLIYDAGNGWLEIQRKASGPPPQLRSVFSTVSASALTVGLSPATIDFRATSLASGNVNSRTIATSIQLTVPNGATLGTVNAVSSRLFILAIYGPVNVEIGIVNATGSINLDETTLINTTAIAVGSNSANVVYSATARANVPFRVIGFIDITETTAGAWNTSPTEIQGAGGLALASLSSASTFGYGQTWQNVTASRTPGTTYTNTTGKPILVAIIAASTSTAYTMTFFTGGLSFPTVMSAPAAGYSTVVPIVIPPGGTYSATVVNCSLTWTELR